MSPFDSFIGALARVKVSDRAFNQYVCGPALAGRPAEAGPHTRRNNLRLYLTEIGQPRILLVGEAPSYRGGRLTGIPFTSEQIMLCGVDGRFLGADRGYRKATPGATCSTEASATIVWATIKHIDPLPLLWNAFPLHPFARGNPFSNRIPTAGELLAGAPFLEMLLRLFPISRVVAVGNLAERSLTRLGIAHTKVRHPSQGGKRKFVEGVERLAADA